MKSRVRRRFLELGRREEARAAEGAWISTIHGFCARILRTHALSAGIDPGFRVLDELEAERLSLDAFDGALEDFMADGVDPERIEMVAAYTPDRLRDMVRTVHSRLRSRGDRHPTLEEVSGRAAAGEHERLDAAARAVLAELALARAIEHRRHRDRDPRALPGPARLDSGRGCARGHPPRAGQAQGARQRRCPRPPATSTARRSGPCARWPCRAARGTATTRCCAGCSSSTATATSAPSAARSGLDFEDLELVARDLLAGDAGLREA